MVIQIDNFQDIQIHNSVCNLSNIDNLELESNVIQGPWKGSTKPLKGTVAETTEIIDISKMTNDDLNKLVDEIHMNEGKMAEVDSTGGTKMGYEEFKKLE